MGASKVIHALYTDDDVLMSAVKTVKAEKHHIEEIYTPFPVHGLDKAMGLAPTRIAIAAFMYGCVGLTVAILMMNFIMIEDWPQNIGGKPSFSYLENFLAFVPISFEFTVLCAAHGMAITYLLRNKTLPGMPAQNPDPRTTDDKFVMELRLSENHNFSAEQLEAMLKDTGIVEIDQKEIK